MPQLILYPWFFIFLCTWTSFLILTPKKILSYITLNNFTLNPIPHQTPSWPWTW